MIRTILQRYREQAAYNKDLGDSFERLIRAYLKLDPQYVSLFSDVWLWKDWPDRESLGYKLPDTGIDIVAKLRDEEGYCAIQCKFYESAVSMNVLGSFLALSGKKGFSRRLLVATSDLTKNAADVLANQTIPVSTLTIEDLEESPVDWEKFSPERPDELTRAPKRPPLPHQTEALNDVLEGFKNRDRGKLIMACGTGKTYASLMIAEKLVERGGHVLFLVPSIALLSQALRSWTSDASLPLRCFAVCSDAKASKDEEDMRISELAYPATTNAERLAGSMKDTYDSKRLTVVFSTYQSLAVVHEAQVRTGVEFDLVICDEAHRTSGYTAKGEDNSSFVQIHDNGYTRGKRRLYMTATPRIYAEASKQKAKEKEFEVFSMDDEATFGPEFHRLRFDEAVRRDLLSDYKVLIIAVDEDRINRVLDVRISNEGDELKLDDAVKIVGCWNGLGKHLAEQDDTDCSVDPAPMRTAIAFSSTIRHSKIMAHEFQRIADDLGGKISYLPKLEAQHVDGTMNVVERNRKLSWLKSDRGRPENVCRILTNARCLSEGVDVPALDAAIFLNPRNSIVDVVQSVGRVMRKTAGKKYGYVIVPIGIRKGTPPEIAFQDNKKYRIVWQVLNSLRAHDDRLERQFATMDLTGKKNGVVNVIGVGGGPGDRGDNGDDRVTRETLDLIFNPEELGKWQDAIYGKIVHKCGNRRYWEDWAKDVAQIAESHQHRIRSMLEKPTPEQRRAFNLFLDGIRRNLNPSIDENQAVEMLAQHIITRPVFDALFEGYAFTQNNPVSQSMQTIMDILDARAMSKDLDVLEGFYASVRERVRGIDDPKGRQRIIVELYDKFFKIAFPRMVERLGIVYTPVELVDFIIRSADEALEANFGCRLQDPGVHILDPFTGTGTFLVRMIESGLIPKKKLTHKYREELHANEIVLLAYYIAAINIEEAYHRVTGNEYEPFPGIVLTDTFQLNEWDEYKGEFRKGIPENSERVKRQKERDIRVIVGNPPYSVGQNSGNDNNQNLKYPKLDGRIAATYVERSTASNKNSLYDSYIRAFRWASDRIGNEGIICFVTNGGWIDGNTMDGFRETLEKEFSAIYVFNLRGNQRTSGELSKSEGGKIFGSGSRTPVAITLLVKRQGQMRNPKIFYHDIGDYLSREKKLEIISQFGSCRSIPWEEIIPNEHHDWLNLRGDDFSRFVPLNDAEDAIFAIRSNGVQTNRDDWVYNFGQETLQKNMKRMIAFYNNQVDEHGPACREKSAKEAPNFAATLLDMNPQKIKWTGSLIDNLCRMRKGEFDKRKIGIAIYRPFCKLWLYYDSLFNHRYKEKLFPTISHKNIAISVTGIGINKDFSCMLVNILPDVQLFANDQCFPLYYYEKNESSSRERESQGLFDESAPQDEYTRIDAITDTALSIFRNHYEDTKISKEDIFFYCYGILHSPEYRVRYASDLKKTLPHIPFAPDFQAFSKAGRELAYWHLEYETIEPYPVTEKRSEQGNLDEFEYFRVEKMTFGSASGRGKDKAVIVYNSKIRISDIPLDAYDYVVNGKSAIEWIMERYAVTVDQESGIVNDPNAWCRENNDPTYILNLLKRVIRVSIETNRIVAQLPKIFE